MRTQLSTAILTILLAGGSLAAHAQDIPAAVAQGIVDVQDDDGACATAALNATESNPTLLEEIAAFSAATCGAGAAGAIASGLAQANPERTDEIVVAMSLANRPLVAEIALSAVSTFPQNQQQAVFDQVFAALTNAGFGDNDPAFAALGDTLPGAGATNVFGAGPVAAGLTTVDELSPN